MLPPADKVYRDFKGRVLKVPVLHVSCVIIRVFVPSDLRGYFSVKIAKDSDKIQLW